MMTRQEILRSFLHRHPGRVAGVFAAGLSAQMLRTAVQLALALLVASVFNFDSLRVNALGLVKGLPDGSILWILPLALTLFLFISLFTEKYLVFLLGEKLSQSLRETLFETQLNTRFAAFSQKPAGAYLLRYSGDLKNIRNFFQYGVIGLVRDLLMLGMGLSITALFSPTLALATLPCFFLVGIVLYFFNQRLYKASDLRRNRLSGLLNFVHLRLQAMEMVQVFNRQSPELGRFKKRSEKVFLAGRKFQLLNSSIKAFVPAISLAMLTLLLIWIGRNPQHLSHDLLPGFLVLTSLMPVFRRLARVSVHRQLGLLSFAKLLAILNFETEVRVEGEELENEVSLKIAGMSFSYSDEISLFSNLELDLPHGTSCQIRGDSGAGKSTLLRLLLGINSPEMGTIGLNGLAYEKLDVRTIRKQFAVVSREFPLLGKTVFEAISYSRKSSKRGRAEKVLKSLQDHVAPSLRLGLEDPIGDFGKLLSQGQVKLLLIARGLLARKPILVLDGVLQGLPGKLQTHLLGRIRRMKGKRTVIILTRENFSADLDLDIKLELGFSSEVKMLNSLAG